MYKHFICTVIIAFVAFCAESSFSQSTDQNYPVTASAFIMPQANQKLAGYFASNRAMTINLVLKDLTKPSIQVYLRWSLDGPGVRVASAEGHIPPNFITLVRGTLQRFSGLDLQNDYFRQDLMEEQGLGGGPSNGSPLRASLPEGFYTFRVQALEAGTGREVSNLGETYFSVTSPLPPVINLPFSGAELMMSEPQRVNIQWMPRHYKLPGNITTYDLKVCKVPEGYEPTEALEACVSPIIDDKANPGTFYPSNTGIGNSIIGAFERGERYAARVTIHEFDINGDEVLFANEGRSEVTWFRYGAPCISPDAFTIKDIGPGRVQLNWQAQAGADSYKILYRPLGEGRWNVQTVSATTATIHDLVKGKYEFAVQSACTETIPDNTQTLEIGEDNDDWGDLPIALANPMQIPVQASGCNAIAPGNLADYYANFQGVAMPGQVINPADTTKKLKIPACALQSSAFSVCSPEHPVILLPTGGTPLGTLKAGDVLGIYDFAVFVTEASGSSGGFSGKGLVRLPFLEGTLALAEFSGVKAWSAQGENGGCIYEVSNFRLLNVSQAEVAAAKGKLINTLTGQNDPGAFAGTLADALAAYDSLSNTAPADSICPYKTAVIQASDQIRDALTDLDTDNPAIAAILADLKAITDSLRAGSAVINITKKYEDLVARLDSLKAVDIDNNQPILAIGNILVSELTGQSARISWEPSGEFSKYIIEYKDPNGGVLQETVSNPQVSLQRLLPGTQYTYRIMGYQGDQVAATYGEDAFKTVRKIVPVPENLDYVAMGGDSVRITWDPNKEHYSFKIKYIDDLGEPRYLYPTTNSAILTGLDPTRFYDYEIVAYNRESLVSDPASARVTAGDPCKLGIIVKNAQNSAGVTGNNNTFLITGCFPKDFVPNGEFPKVSWSNGTPGVVGANGVITFGDGETAEISTNSTPFIGADRALFVSPSENKSYTAVCKMSAAAEPCTYTVNVKVSSPDCKTDFKITASSETFERGEQIVLKSSGCDGKLLWSRAIGDKPEIKIFPSSDLVMYATCTTGEVQCISNTLALSAKKDQDPICDLQVYLAWVKVEENWPFTNRKIRVQSVGCENGQISWSADRTYRGGWQDHRLKYESSGSNFIELQRLGDAGSVNSITARCFVEGKEICSKVIEVTTPFKDCHGTGLDIVSDNSNKNTSIKIVSAASGFKLADNQGKIYGSKTATDGSFYAFVPLSTSDVIYHADFDNGCKIDKLVPASIFKIDWNWQNQPVSGDYKDFTDADRKQTLSLNLVNEGGYTCPGTIAWSNDKDDQIWLGSTLSLSDDRGKSLIPFPPVTTTYFATCRLQNGISLPAENEKLVIVNSNDCFRIEPRLASVTKGEKLRLTALGCTNAVWTQGGSYIGTGRELTIVPSPETTPVILTYIAQCDELKCSEEISVEILPCNFKINAPAAPIKIAEPTTLTASGCSGGIIQWSTEEVGSSIVVKPTNDTEYKAWCTINGLILCDASTSVSVQKTPPDEIECPNFSVAYTPRERCIPITITPSGCPASGTILWDNTSTTRGDESFSVVLGAGRIITATCTTQYGQKASDSVTPILNESTIAVTPLEVYPGYPAILRASGCVNDQCQDGLYTWKNLNTGAVYNGSSLKETLSEPTNFEVSCNGGDPKKISIGVKETCDGGYKQPSINGSKSKLKVDDSCKPEYTISWYDNTDNFNVLIAKNVRQVTVNVPICGNDLSGTRYYKAICVNESLVPCTTYFTVGCKPNGSTGAITTDTPTTPDVCNDLAFVEKKSGTKYTPWELLSDWCTGSKVIWYRDEDRTDVVAILRPPAIYNLGKIREDTPFYASCFLADNTECKSQIFIEINGSGRIEARQNETPGESEKDCPDNVPLTTAMEVYYKTLLCQTSNLYKGDRAAATAFVEDMIASIKAKSLGVNIQFPANLNAVIDAMVAGDCDKAAQLLAAANSASTIDNTDFNNQLVDTYNQVIDDLIPKEGAQCNAAPPPVLASGIKENISGRVEAYDYTGLFISPDGRAVRLPAGAKPRIFRFNKDYATPPTGTLHGFELSDGTLYYAEIFPGNMEFLGYRRVKTGECEYLNTIYVAPGTKAYYLEKFSENGKCGYRFIEGEYMFEPNGSAQTIDIQVPVTGKTVGGWEYETCPEGPEYLTKAGQDKLAKKLLDFGDKNTGITISDCKKTEKHTVSAEGVDKVITGKLIQIIMCWDGKKWVITHSFKPGALQIPNGYTGTAAEVEAISNEHANRVMETGVKPSDDGENYYEGIDFIQALVEVKEATLTLCNNAKVPEKYWETKDAGYAKSPFHGPTLSGIGDGAITELKDIPEMVGFGLEIATEPGKARELWQVIKSITPDKVKKMALGAAQEKLDKYAAGGNTMKHEAGKDAVSIAMFVSGAVKSFATNGKKIAELGEVVGKLDDVADNVLEQVTKNVDEVAGKSINKALKDGDLDALDVEEIAEEVKDATSKADKSWLENLIKGKKYGENITNKYIKTLDEGYFTKASKEFGISKEELKTMAHIDELQINIGNGNFAVADNVWNKKVVVNGKEEIHIYLNETKLNAGTSATKRQNELFSAAQAGSPNLTVRSLSKDGFEQGNKVIIKGIIKTNGNGSVSDFYDISKIY